MKSIRQRRITLVGLRICTALAVPWPMVCSAAGDEDITKVVNDALLVISSSSSSGIGLVQFGSEVMTALRQRAIPALQRITSPNARAFSLAGAAQAAAELGRRDWTDSLTAEVKKTQLTDFADNLILETELGFAFAREGRLQLVRTTADQVLASVPRIPRADRRIEVLAYAAPLFLVSGKFSEAQRILEHEGSSVVNHESPD
jgi:hypothetical protein